MILTDILPTVGLKHGSDGGCGDIGVLDANSIGLSSDDPDAYPSSEHGL